MQTHNGWFVALLSIWIATAGHPCLAAEGNTTVAQGRKLFNATGCYSCHGYEGQGALVTGPRLAPSPLPLAAFIEMVRRPPNVMPAYSPRVLADEALAKIHAFLQSIPTPPDPQLFADPMDSR